MNNLSLNSKKKNQYNLTSLELEQNNANLIEFYHNIEKKISILPVILMIAGTLGNLIAFYVLTRKKLRSQSTMLYFASLTVMDTISLYQWNFNFFYKYQLNSENQNIEDQSLFLCRYISFMAHWSMQTSAWILTIISIDRYLIMTNSNWKQRYSRNIKFSLVVILAIAVIIALINLPVVFLNGKLSPNKLLNNLTNHSIDQKELSIYTKQKMTRKVECYTTKFIKLWQKVALVLECFFPLILMIIFNFLLIKRTYKSSTRLNLANSSKHSNLKKSVSMAGNLAPPSDSKSFENSNYDISSIHEVKEPKIMYKKSDHFSSSIYLSDISRLNRHKDNNRNLSTVLRKFKSDSNSMNKTESIDKINKPISNLDKNNLLTVEPIVKNSSLSNLVFINSPQNSNEPVNPSFLSVSNAFSVNNKNNSKGASCNNLSSIQRNSSGDTARSLLFLSDNLRSSKRHFLNYRNRRIVLMLSLLTLSFTISTLPSSIFYTFFRPILNNKPYKRLLSLSFNLLRHLSHTFNFIIYFTSSSIIKQQLREIFNQKNLKKFSFNCLIKYLYYSCCCFNSKLKKNNTIGNTIVEENHLKSKRDNSSYILKSISDLSQRRQNILNRNDDFKMKILKMRQNSLMSIDPSIGHLQNNEIINQSNLDDINYDDDENSNITISNLNNNNNKNNSNSTNINNSFKKSTSKAASLNVPKLMLNFKNISNDSNCSKPFWF